MSVADVDRQMHDLQTWPAHSSSTEFSKFRSVSRSVIINIHTYEVDSPSLVHRGETERHVEL